MVTVTSSADAAEVTIPPTWCDFNWEHPYVFLSNAGRTSPRERQTLRAPADKINSGWQYVAQLNRRSLFGRQPDGLTFEQFSKMLATLYAGLADHPHLFAAVGTTSVEGFKDDAYMCHVNPRSLRAQSAGRVAWSAGIQGQAWADGPGACFMLGADWTRMAAPGTGREYDYGHALFDVGRVGQALTMESRNLGLRTRMTPAVKESFYADILSLGHDLDVLYFLEVARPASHPGDSIQL